jgi:hypothetical protein
VFACCSVSRHRGPEISRDSLWQNYDGSEIRVEQSVRLGKGMEGMYLCGCYGFFLAGKYFFSIDATTT